MNLSNTVLKEIDFTVCSVHYKFNLSEKKQTERIMQAAKERGCILELNAQPERMDLDDVHCKIAKEMQLKIAISTDAHSLSQLDNMQLGIYQARRGWLEPRDVINTYHLSHLKKLLFRR